MVRKGKKRGPKPGFKRAPRASITELPSLTDITDILNARESLRGMVKSRIKQLNQILKRI